MIKSNSTNILDGRFYIGQTVIPEEYYLDGDIIIIHSLYYDSRKILHKNCNISIHI